MSISDVFGSRVAKLLGATLFALLIMGIGYQHRSIPPCEFDFTSDVIDTSECVVGDETRTRVDFNYVVVGAFAVWGFLVAMILPNRNEKEVIAEEIKKQAPPIESDSSDEVVYEFDAAAEPAAPSQTKPATKTKKKTTKSKKTTPKKKKTTKSKPKKKAKKSS